MKNEEVIKRLMEYRPEKPDADAVKRCMAALPQVKPALKIRPLLKTQTGFLSGLVYGISLLLYLAAAFAAVILDMEEYITLTSMLPVLVIALIAGQIGLTEYWDMQELERVCRYSYGQLLLARIVCIGAWIILLNGALGAVFLASYQAPAARLFVWLMPTVIASAAALVPETLFGVHSSLIQMVVFLVAAALVNQAIPLLLSLSGRMQVLSVTFFFAALAGTVLQGMVIYRRRVMNEAYSM